jgi:murein DD-endopeptidase MepM/ murein hydrolase activator NlpD
VRLNATKWRSPFSKSLTSGLRLKLDDMTDRLNAAEEKVHTVFALQKDRQYFWASLPTIWPTRGWITSEFGDGRRWGGRGRGRIHEGIDIAAPRGTPVLSPGSGIVTYSGYRHGYGKMLVIDHGYGIMTVYAHCQNLYSYEGQAVKRGMIIASVGNTGRSSGPHLHYEVHVDGQPVNPVLYVMDEM